MVEKPRILAPVKLVGTDGNVFALIALCRRAARQYKYTDEQVNQFMKEVTDGDYNHALGVMMEWFEVD